MDIIQDDIVETKNDSPDYDKIDFKTDVEGSDHGDEVDQDGKGYAGNGDGDQKGQSDEQGQGKGDGKGDGKSAEQEAIDQCEKKDFFTLDDIEPGDTIAGTIKFNEHSKIKSAFNVDSKNSKDKKIKLSDIARKGGYQGRAVRMSRLEKDCILIKTSKLPKNQKGVPKLPAKVEPLLVSNAVDDMFERFKAGARNMWMVGPAGCGKTTMAQMLADRLGFPLLPISCGQGTSAAEFIGYKYPEREATEFAWFYERETVILLDEFTALDPNVAQIVNAALANDGFRITTSTATDETNRVKRHENCIIIATSNTFGTGGNPQYVANNQLDAATRDRFVGNIIEVDYDAEYEKRYDPEVVLFVRLLRRVIETSRLARVASTRMIQAGERLKKHGYTDWHRLLVTDWDKRDISLINQLPEITKYKLTV